MRFLTMWKSLLKTPQSHWFIYRHKDWFAWIVDALLDYLLGMANYLFEDAWLGKKYVLHKQNVKWRNGCTPEHSFTSAWKSSSIGQDIWGSRPKSSNANLLSTFCCCSREPTELTAIWDKTWKLFTYPSLCSSLLTNEITFGTTTT